MSPEADTFIDAEFEVGAALDVENDFTEEPSIPDMIVKIGQIASNLGDSELFVSRTGRYVTHKRKLDVPLSDARVIHSTVQFATQEIIDYTGVHITLSGPPPAHYQNEAVYVNVQYLPKNVVYMTINKLIYPEVKNFDKPLPPDTEFELKYYRDNPEIGYRNKDGDDFFHIAAPIRRLPEDSLRFLHEFLTNSLSEFEVFAEMSSKSTVDTKQDESVCL